MRCAAISPYSSYINRPTSKFPDRAAPDGSKISYLTSFQFPTRRRVAAAAAAESLEFCAAGAIVPATTKSVVSHFMPLKLAGFSGSISD